MIWGYAPFCGSILFSNNSSGGHTGQPPPAERAESIAPGGTQSSSFLLASRGPKAPPSVFHPPLLPPSRLLQGSLLRPGRDNAPEQLSWCGFPAQSSFITSRRDTTTCLPWAASLTFRCHQVRLQKDYSLGGWGRGAQDLKEGSPNQWG